MEGTLGTVDALRDVLSWVQTLPAGSDDSERIDRIRVLEEIKAAVSAAQLVEAAHFDASRRSNAARTGERVARQGRGVASEVALARRCSPWAAARWLGQAKILTAELPGTFAELRAGRTTQWRALLVARETAVLSRADRARVDAQLSPQLEHLGDGKVEALARRAAYRLDPHAALARTRQAESDRRVTVRPAPDSMVRLSALLPVAQGIACYASLSRHADSLRAAGSGGIEAGSGRVRGRGQVMADTLVERLTGQASAEAVPVEIGLVVTTDVLLGQGRGRFEPGHVDGYGPIPAGLARELALVDDAADGADGRTANVAGRRWVRRLFANPETGQLVALESTRRIFPAGLKRFLTYRDQTCVTPWCDAPIRHADHVRPKNRGGPTSAANGVGRCEACNYAREATGWTADIDSHTGTVETMTPTGHRYRHAPPPTPVPAEEPDWLCPIDQMHAPPEDDFVLAA